MRRMAQHTLIALFLVGVAGGWTARGQAEELNRDKLNTKISNVTLKNAAGQAVSLYDLNGKKAIVVVFLSFECPVSNSYAAVLADLARTYGQRGVAFVGVNSVDEGDAAQIARQAAAFKLPFPVIKDQHHRATDALHARTVPEAFVLDPNFVLRYRGRIDDSYQARLKKNRATTHHDLRQALDEVLAGKTVRVPSTPVVGCPIPPEETDRPAGKVTFTRDVLPILQNNCQGCHRPGEVGPFSLLTYKQAVRWAADIKETAQRRKMPPWKPVEGLEFHNTRRMSAKEIATLAAWVDGGTPEGDPQDAPPPRKFVHGWQLGKPDLVLTPSADMTIGGSGKDLFRCFVLPTGLTEDKYVVAIEVRPGNKRVVHHTLNFLDRTGQGRQLEKKERERVKKPEEQDQGLGYTVAMGIGFPPQGGLSGWAPGQMARVLPDGVGYLLPKGSDVIVQVHYHRTGRTETDRTRIGLYFAKKPISKPFKNITIPGRFFSIPAADSHYRVTGAVEVLQDCTLHSVMPHMHLLGRTIKVTLTPPTGKPFTLVAIDDWDYNWQETYFLEKPLSIKAGTKLSVEAVYDNSADNPNNPTDPPRRVFFGEQTTDEMCFVFLGVTSETPGRIKTKRTEITNGKPQITNNK